MKDKIKKIFKNRIFIFGLGILLSGSVSVLAVTYFPSDDVTYDNKTSGLKSTDVQGAIDELYSTCINPPTAGGSILDKEPIVTTGDGLYEDEYEEGKYTYKGVNPNNYVTFNNETAGWRIISINLDGTIKIMKDESIGDIALDTSGSNNWARPATLNTYLNENYYDTLTSTAQSQIISSNYGTGAVTYNNNDLVDQINDENVTTWNGKVALPTVSEYIRSNSNTSSCGTSKLINNNYSTCRDTTWMYISNYWRTISPQTFSTNSAFIVHSNGSIYCNIINNVSYAYGVRPVVTLSSELQITGGTGTQSDPYAIS